MGRVFGVVPGVGGRPPRKRLPVARGRFVSVGTVLTDAVTVLASAPPRADRITGWVERLREGGG
jgi:hypothetical protein